MPRVIAIANQKGGVAKTTTTHALAAGLTERGRRVLAIDLDAQASLTWAMGVESEPDPSIHHVMMGKADLDDILYESNGIDLAPSSIDLAGAEMHLITRTGREYVLERALRTVEDRYDLILIDCAPSLGILTINALTAAAEVIVPLQAEALARRGLDQFLETVADVRQFTNPDLTVTGAIVTMFDGRTRHGQGQLAALEAMGGITVLRPPVPKSIRVAEAPGQGLSVLGHAASNPAAVAYREIVEALDA